MSVLLRRYYQLLRYSRYGIWLLPATISAIFGAFGNAGLAVIKATNAYLNGIAATDSTKAQALAGYINEDPMMVCSLGLSVESVIMPIRWLVSNKTTGTAQIFIPDGFGDSPAVEARVRFRGGPSGHQYFVKADAATRFLLQVNNPYGYALSYNGVNNAVVAAKSDYSGTTALLTRTLRVERGKLYINGTQISSFTPASVTYEQPADLQIYPLTDDPLWIAQINSVSQGGTYPHRIVPFIGRTLGDGVYDFYTNMVYINSGTDKFSVAYTLQDGETPWTPGTPIP